jgi:hypothetical protein
VGFGDIHAVTIYEKIAATCSMLVGGFVFGMVVATLSEIARNTQYGDALTDQELGKVSTDRPSPLHPTRAVFAPPPPPTLREHSGVTAACHSASQSLSQAGCSPVLQLRAHSNRVPAAVRGGGCR